MSSRSEKVKADTVGICGQMFPAGVGHFRMMTDGRWWVERWSRPVESENSRGHEVRALEAAPTWMLKSS